MSCLGTNTPGTCNQPAHGQSEVPAPDARPSPRSGGPVTCGRLCRLEAGPVPGATTHAASFENLRGLGVRATVDGETYHVGRPKRLDRFDVEPADAAVTFAAEAGVNARRLRTVDRSIVWWPVGTGRPAAGCARIPQP